MSFILKLELTAEGIFKRVNDRVVPGYLCGAVTQLLQNI
jgi:hypothetical protein